MNRVHIIVEGQTEETFVCEVLAPALRKRNVDPSACLIGEGGHKGGDVSYTRARHDVVRLLKGDRRAYCTTMFDFFRLSPEFPRKAIVGPPSTVSKASMVEEAFFEDIAETLGDNWVPCRFIPYIQMHEFEGLLFSDTAAFARGIYRPDLMSALTQIREPFETPEDIDDGPQTAPSKRVLALYPGYDKVAWGTLAALEVGLDAIRRECPHFAQWLARLESLGNVSA